jgi:predicted porin
LTFFRQNDLMQDAILSYDPMGVSGAFSPLGFFGGFAGGGDTENRRDTTAIKYRVNLANWHFGAYAQVGGYNEGNAAKGSYSGDVGTDIKLGSGLLSADVVGQFRKDAVALAMVGPVDAFGFPTNPFTDTHEAASATISNNTSVMALAKYQVDRLKLYAGWEWIQFAPPSDTITSFTDIAGDFLCANCQGFNNTNVASFAAGTKEIKQLAWVGARYSLTDSLDVAAAYYHEWQNNFSNGVSAAGGTITCATVSTFKSSCQGTKDSASALLDWKFAPKWDTYLGVNYARNAGGDLNGYLQKDVWATTGGVRFRF